MKADRNSAQKIEAANRLPISRTAREILAKTEWGANPMHLHPMTLMMYAAENGAVAAEVDLAAVLAAVEDRHEPAEIVEMVATAPIKATDDPTEAGAMLAEELIASLKAT